MELKTSYLGLELKNPLLAGASPLSSNVDAIRELEDQGISGVTMFSLFEEQLQHDSESLDYFLHHGVESFPEALSYLPGQISDFKLGPQEYLEQISRLKNAVEIPVLASLNGVTPGGWVNFAREMEQAGADALELNIYHIPTSADESGAAVEKRYCDTVEMVKQTVSIPVSVKIGPFFSSPAHFATQLKGAGANGLVLFNRFFQPDIDMESLEIEPSINLSHHEEIRLPMRWLSIISGAVDMDLCGSTGVNSGRDVLRLIMSGATCVQCVSTLIKHGLGRVGHILSEINDWMEEHEYDSISQMKGSMNLRNVHDPDALVRANYLSMVGTRVPQYAKG